MKKLIKITFILVLLAIIAYFGLGDVGVTASNSECPVPQIHYTQVSKDATFQFELLAEAKARLPKSVQELANADVKGNVLQLLQRLEHAEISPTFYEWYLAKRSGICTLLAYIEFLESSERPNEKLISKSQYALLELIVSFEDWKKSEPVDNTDRPITESELKQAIEKTIREDILPKIAYSKRQMKRAGNSNKKFDAREMYLHYQADLEAMNLLLTDFLPSAKGDQKELVEVQKVFEEIKRELG